VALVGEASWLVVLPTHDHPSTIAHAAGSVLDQGVQDFRLVIIGDGVGDDTRDVVADLCRADVRISFVDRPKVPGRNEAARHAVVSASESPLITYLGDDDLFLPHHLETMQDLLAEHDFAHPAPVFVEPSRQLLALPTDLSDPRCVRWHLHPGHNAVSLTGAAHTGDLYRRLPFGWRPAPPGRWSDHYMWEQIFTLEGAKLATSPWATTVKLSADKRVGLDHADRAQEISWWRGRIDGAGFREWWDAEVTDAIHRCAIDQFMRASELYDELASVRDSLAAEAPCEPRGSVGPPEVDHRYGSREDHQVEVLRSQHATLVADHDRVRQAMDRITGTRTWRLRNRLIGSRRVDPMVARPTGTS
jgi:glycosyltransferase involved in cell wall biosynthesis